MDAVAGTCRDKYRSSDGSGAEDFLLSCAVRLDDVSRIFDLLHFQCALPVEANEEVLAEAEEEEEGIEVELGTNEIRIEFEDEDGNIKTTIIEYE